MNCESCVERNCNSCGKEKANRIYEGQFVTLDDNGFIIPLTNPSERIYEVAMSNPDDKGVVKVYIHERGLRSYEGSYPTRRIN